MDGISQPIPDAGVRDYAVRKRVSSPEAWIRMAIGPLAMAGFFLPWTHGIGPLAANNFTGFRLAGYAGRLQALDLSLAAGGVLWAIRLLIVGVAVAAAWQALLAPGHRSHRVYAISGWYLVGFAAAAAALGLLKAGITIPPPGLALLLLAATSFATLQLLDNHRSR